MRTMKAVTAMLCLVFSGPIGIAEEMSYGQAEYLNSCAVCHGVEGKGDGPWGTSW